MGATPSAHVARPGWILAATILGSSLAFIDGTVVNVALPSIQHALNATVADAQWVVESYALLLAALILLGGAAGDFYEQSAEAARRLERRALLLVGRDPHNQPRRPLPPGVIAVQYAPHSAVFPSACAVVHQGGIGTTGESMRAGHPTLVVHYGHDQPDNAARLVRMGMARSIPRERYNAEPPRPPTSPVTSGWPSNVLFTASTRPGHSEGNAAGTKTPAW